MVIAQLIYCSSKSIMCAFNVHLITFSFFSHLFLLIDTIHTYFLLVKSKLESYFYSVKIALQSNLKFAEISVLHQFLKFVLLNFNCILMDLNISTDSNVFIYRYVDCESLESH